ncbi:MAG: glycogen synthase GlgA [Acetobacteraceae bacterium]|nr:glycogen synthase GlgA [Acetobacteraceae bacterium]
MRVLSAASEIYPLIKTGGLADVVGALPRALAAEGVAVCTLVPGYPAVMEALGSSTVAHTLPNLFGAPARVLAGSGGGLDLFVIDAPHLFGRPGNPYIGPDRTDWPDNAFRFAALSRVAAEIGLGAVDAFRPDIVHGHDWQAGLVPAYLHYSGQPRPATVITVHNMAFQGQFPPDVFAGLGLPPTAFSIEGLEYYGMVGYLKAGLQLADRITSVSPTYATEIMTPEGGMGLEGLLRGRSGVLCGILNGIDEAIWNPAADPMIPVPFDLQSLNRRAANTRALQERLALHPDPRALVFAVISRLSWQKGIDLLLDAIPRLLESGAQLALLGTGDAMLEPALETAARAHPGRVACVIGQDEALAHLMQAGAAALLVASRFEPCGLSQLCALRYGAVPVVARTGGLADTVIDANEMAMTAGVATGIQFPPGSKEMLDAAIRRTAAIFEDNEAWLKMQANGMRTDVSWRRPAKRYAQLYRDLLNQRRLEQAA